MVLISVSFIYLIGNLDCTHEHFTYGMTATVMMGGRCCWGENTTISFCFEDMKSEYDWTEYLTCNSIGKGVTGV